MNRTGSCLIISNAQLYCNLTLKDEKQITWFGSLLSLKGFRCCVNGLKVFILSVCQISATFLSSFFAIAYKLFSNVFKLFTRKVKDFVHFSNTETTQWSKTIQITLLSASSLGSLKAVKYEEKWEHNDKCELQFFSMN